MIVRPNIGRRGVVAGIGAVGAALATGNRRAQADEAAVPVPTGPVILTVSGHITSFNAGNKVAFDMATLESVAHDGFTTSNPVDAGRPPLPVCCSPRLFAADRAATGRPQSLTR